MTSAEIHVVLHLIEVPTSLIMKNILKYQEMYQFFSELLPQWLMHEFHNSNAQTDQEETYAFFVPHQLGLPAYVVLSMIVPEGTHIHDIQQQI